MEFVSPSLRDCDSWDELTFRHARWLEAELRKARDENYALKQTNNRLEAELEDADARAAALHRRLDELAAARGKVENVDGGYEPYE